MLSNSPPPADAVVRGAWLLAVVSTQSLALLGARIAASTGGKYGEIVFVLIHALWAVGLVLYGLLLGQLLQMRANQLRLWFASMAYVLLCALRRIGLHDTEFATATCGTIRLKLLKIGALVHISVRRIKVAMASACPTAAVWGLVAARLAGAARPPPA
jgi:hypothetical protein